MNPLTGHHSLIATTSFTEDTPICTFSAAKTDTQPSRYTVQTGATTHIHLLPGFLQYINHSCKPNSFFNTETFQLVALRDIEAGEEFTFFYPSTEWNMAEPFQCFCGEENCLGLIAGASQMQKDLLQDYRLTSFIQNKLNSTQL
jgi:hypothetical protein